MMSNIYEEVVNIITEVNNDLIIKEDDYDNLLKDLGVDSLDMANILLELEEKYNVNFLEEDIEQLNSVNLIVKFVNKNLNK